LYSAQRSGSGSVSFSEKEFAVAPISAVPARIHAASAAAVPENVTAIQTVAGIASAGSIVASSRYGL
jgi:hypothetical protein